jgi:hypothetical protein
MSDTEFRGKECRGISVVIQEEEVIETWQYIRKKGEGGSA